MYLGQAMYLHTNDMEELLNNLLFMVKDRLTLEEQYMITKEYHKIKYRELENKQLQEKELKEKTKTIEDTIIKELNKSFK